MDPLRLYQAVLVVLHDEVPMSVDAIFQHDRSYGDDDGLCEESSLWLKSNRARFVAINGADGEGLCGIPGQASPGKKLFLGRFSELGIAIEDKILLTDPAPHTRKENDAFLKLARVRGWKSAITLTQPHQLLRAVLGQIKTMAEQGYWMRLYALSPRPCDWGKVVRGSQGFENKPRFDHIRDELTAIERYQARGHLATFGDLFEYLNRRHTIV
jgi:hypothetical protein